jgi:hypothetical protein
MIARIAAGVCGAVVMLTLVGTAAAERSTTGIGSYYGYGTPSECVKHGRDSDGSVTIECNHREFVNSQSTTVFYRPDDCVERSGTLQRQWNHQWFFRGKANAPLWQNVIFGSASVVGEEWLSYTDTAVPCP